ncbi:MAG TPA: rhomboid family intramembrane serine protease [Opitutaceae bacterium]|jgi:membrane associated rhomboid family serine protease|nr:rhomboid family intramembrane serine protease [Opitutaceae bacterium]
MLPLWEENPARRAAPVAPVLVIAANLGVFIHEVMLAMQDPRVLEAFIGAHALVPGRLVADWDQAREWKTLFTHMFIHGGVAHVAGNCWFLWVFGKSVEDRLGSMKFILFYLLCGLAAAGLQVAAEPHSALPMLGASGAISGVLGAYLIMFPTAWIVTLVPWIVPIIPVPAFLFLIVWFVFQTLNGVGSMLSGADAAGGVAWWAHAGGFTAGVILILWAKGAGLVRRS